MKQFAPSPQHSKREVSCLCCRGDGVLGRRRMLAFGGGMLGASLLNQTAAAASGEYEAMLVNCIDPRFTDASARHMATNAMRGRYSHFVIAGGPIGAVHPRFAAWHAAFWDNLDITVQLHHIKRVVAMTHRDCGAAKLAFGDAAVATREAESASHGEVLRAFVSAVHRRQPALTVVAGIMDIDGNVDVVG